MTPITYTEASPLQFEDQALYLVEGTLSELQIAPTTVNLLEKIDGNIKAKSAVAGTAAVLGDMYGMVANSAAIALYDGEQTFTSRGRSTGRSFVGPSSTPRTSRTAIGLKLWCQSEATCCSRTRS